MPNFCLFWNKENNNCGCIFCLVASDCFYWFLAACLCFQASFYLRLIVAWYFKISKMSQLINNPICWLKITTSICLSVLHHILPFKPGRWAINVDVICNWIILNWFSCRITDVALCDFINPARYVSCRRTFKSAFRRTAAFRNLQGRTAPGPTTDPLCRGRPSPRVCVVMGNKNMNPKFNML